MKMADAEESNDCSINAGGDVRRARAPSKKKFDEEMEALSNSIRKTEEQLAALKTGPGSFADASKSLKAEKNANIERRKKIDADLQKLNKDITEMMNSISRLESALHYRSEDKIDEAIRRLEWSLKVQNFKLSQEKKIVAEIDSLRRSKKTLIQYLSRKKDKDAMRDRQRRMREERDYYFHKVTQLKQREEKLRSENTGQRVKSEQLKKELDRLYETKRQMVAQYKKQREDFFDDREKRRHESFKKRAEEKQALQTALRLEREVFEVPKPPVEDNICLCNTLIQYLRRFISGTDLEVGSPGVTVTPPPPALPSPCEESAGLPTGPAEELEDGQYVLLRKPEDDSYVSCSAKHAARKQRRSRKQSVVKRITHTPEVLTQFSLLNLNAPTTVAEILASLEQLRARKLYYEREAEVRSEAELSVTESAQCEVSRQASHTESNDDLGDSQPSDHVMEQLLLSVSDHMGCCLDDHTADNDYDNDDPAANVDTPCSECSASSGSHVDSSAHSRSRSEGSDSTPRDSFTWGCGDTEEGVGQSAREDVSVAGDGQSVWDVSVPGSFTNQDSCSVASSSAVKADTPCDCSGSDVFYAKKAQLAPDPSSSSSPEICSDLASIDNNRTKSVTRSLGQADKGGGERGIREDKAKEPTSLHFPSRAQRCDSTSSSSSSGTSMTADNTNVSSLEDFPALAREGPCELGGSSGGDLLSRQVFLLQGKQTGLSESTRL